jgi:methylated-DNA-[protein]-cysteine S-methyltransferase
MTTYDDELIAFVLGDRQRSPALARWLGTLDGRRELRAWRRTLEALEQLYGDAGAAPQPVLHYCGIRTPIGRVFVAASEAGLVRVSFRQSEAAFVAELRQRLGADPIRSPARTADIVHQLRAYFAGERRRFDVRLDLRHITPFQRRVLMAAARVPAGQVVSYGEIARRIGQPRGSRAVGQALGHNPIPIVIPCHRVIGAGGRIGGYTGGLGIKRKLLRLEGALAAVAG